MGCPHSLVFLKKVCCCLYFCWSNFHHLLAKLMISTCLQYRPITSHYSKHNIKHHQWVTYICCLCFVWSNFHHLLAKLMISTCLHHQPSCQQLTPLKTQHQTSLMGHVHLLFLLCLVQFPPSLGQIDDLHMSTPLSHHASSSYHSKHNIKHHRQVMYICCLCFVWSNFHHLLAELTISTCLHHQPIMPTAHTT